MESAPAPSVWRTKLRSTIVEDHARQVEFCLTRNVIGFGWSAPGVKSGSGEKTLEKVCSSVSKADWSGWGPQAANQIRRFAAADDGDYVWIRDTDGLYWLGRLAGPWRFVSSATSKQHKDLDLHQLRATDWAPVPAMPENVPGVLVNAFSGQAQAWCRVGSGELQGDFAEWTNEYAWKKLNRRRVERPDCSPEVAIASRLNWKQLEDLVLIWLQWKHDLVLVPSSRGKDTPRFECVLKPRNGRGRCLPQVKSGSLNWDAYTANLERGDRVFGFSARSDYKGKQTGKCVKITTEDLVAFASSSEGKRLLPESITWWLG